MKGDPANPADWLRLPKRDKASADQNIAAGDVHAACFFLQQSAEKCIKAWLISKGWELIRTHDFKRLRTDTLDLGMDLGDYAGALDRLGRLYLTDRYVTETDEPEPDQAEVEVLEGYIDRLMSHLFPTEPTDLHEQIP
jgi:HEPN domain-containing protein